jgi:hypothetical protein
MHILHLTILQVQRLDWIGLDWLRFGYGRQEMKKTPIAGSLILIGGSCGDRTCDKRIKRPLRVSSSHACLLLVSSPQN